MNIQFRNCPKSTLPTRVGWTPHWKLGFWRLPAIVLVIFTWTDLFHKKRWTFFHNVCLKPSQPSTKVSSVMIFWPRNGRNTPSHWKAHPLWVWLWMARCTSSWETFRKKGFSASHRTCWSVVVFPVACMPMRATMPFLPRPRGWLGGQSSGTPIGTPQTFLGGSAPFGWHEPSGLARWHSTQRPWESRWPHYQRWGAHFSPQSISPTNPTSSDCCGVLSPHGCWRKQRWQTRMSKINTIT